MKSKREKIDTGKNDRSRNGEKREGQRGAGKREGTFRNRKRIGADE